MNIDVLDGIVVATFDLVKLFLCYWWWHKYVDTNLCDNRNFYFHFELTIRRRGDCKGSIVCLETTKSIATCCLDKKTKSQELGEFGKRANNWIHGICI